MMERKGRKKLKRYWPYVRVYTYIDTQTRTHTHAYPHIIKGNSDQLARSGTSKTAIYSSVIFFLLFIYLLQSSIPQNHVHQVWNLITSKYFMAVPHSWKKSLLVFLTFRMPQGGCMTEPEGNIVSAPFKKWSVPCTPETFSLQNTFTLVHTAYDL